jgi:hypothetical protein
MHAYAHAQLRSFEVSQGPLLARRLGRADAVLRMGKNIGGTLTFAPRDNIRP